MSNVEEKLETVKIEVMGRIRCLGDRGGRACVKTGRPARRIFLEISNRCGI
jgi:hypothetical protein